MCDHAHDKICPFCDRLKDTLKEIELNLREANLVKNTGMALCPPFYYQINLTVTKHKR